MASLVFKYKSYPPSLTFEQLKHAKKMIQSGQETVSGMAKLLGINRSTLYRRFNK